MLEKTNDQECFSFSMTGIDGAGKSTIGHAVLARLHAEGNKVSKVGLPSYVFEDEGTTTQIYGNLTRRLDALHTLADQRQSRYGIMGVNVMNVLLQSRILEDRVRQQSPYPDIIASFRDFRIDPAVYATFYCPAPLRALSVAQRVRYMQRLTKAKRHLVIALKVSPQRAMERITARINKEVQVRTTLDGSAATMRDKWRHMHETEKALGILQRSYTDALDTLQAITPVTVVEIDTDNSSIETVTKIAHCAVKDTMNGALAPGARIKE